MRYPIRINKYLRDKGFSSRREADKLINEGVVLINGEIAKLGDFVEEIDKVEVKEIKKDCKYLAYYKPRGLPTQDLPGNESVITIWKSDGVYPIGRLDKESEGLLLLTNDGRFVREVLSKKKKYEKEYLVTVREHLDPQVVKIFEAGMFIKKFGQLLPVKTEIVDKNTLKMTLREGKRHQIRVMLDSASYTVTSLKRIRIGGFHLEDLQPKEVREINSQ